MSELALFWNSSLLPIPDSVIMCCNQIQELCNYCNYRDSLLIETSCLSAISRGLMTVKPKADNKIVFSQFVLAII